MNAIDLNKVNYFQVNELNKVNAYLFAPYCSTIYIGIIEYA